MFLQRNYINFWKNKKIFCIVSDISPAGSMINFSKEFPDRFINVGVAEQSDWD